MSNSAVIKILPKAARAAYYRLLGPIGIWLGFMLSDFVPSMRRSIILFSSLIAIVLILLTRRKFNEITSTSMALNKAANGLVASGIFFLMLVYGILGSANHQFSIFLFGPSGRYSPRNLILIGSIGVLLCLLLTLKSLVEPNSDDS